MPYGQGSGWVRYGLPGILLGFVATLALQGWGVKAQAEQGAPAERAIPRNSEPAGTNGTIAFTTQSGVGGSAQLLYLIDTRSKAFAVYRVDPNNSKGTVKLEAARQYQWDLQLAEYNNQEPNVAAIESTVKSLGQPTR